MYPHSNRTWLQVHSSLNSWLALNQISSQHTCLIPGKLHKSALEFIRAKTSYPFENNCFRLYIQDTYNRLMYKEQVILKILIYHPLVMLWTIPCSVQYILYCAQYASFCVKSPDGLLYLPNVQYRMEHTVLGNVSHNATCSTQCDNKYKLWFWTYISYYIFSFTQYEVIWQQYSCLKCLAMHILPHTVKKKYSILQFSEHSLCVIFNHTDTSFTYDSV